MVWLAVETAENMVMQNVDYIAWNILTVLRGHLTVTLLSWSKLLSLEVKNFRETRGKFLETWKLKEVNYAED